MANRVSRMSSMSLTHPWGHIRSYQVTNCRNRHLMVFCCYRWQWPQSEATAGGIASVMNTIDGRLNKLAILVIITLFCFHSSNGFGVQIAQRVREWHSKQLTLSRKIVIPLLSCILALLPMRRKSNNRTDHQIRAYFQDSSRVVKHQQWLNFMSSLRYLRFTPFLSPIACFQRINRLMFDHHLWPGSI